MRADGGWRGGRWEEGDEEGQKREKVVICRVFCVIRLVNVSDFAVRMQLTAIKLKLNELSSSDGNWQDAIYLRVVAAARRNEAFNSFSLFIAAVIVMLISALDYSKKKNSRSVMGRDGGDGGAAGGAARPTRSAI